MMREKTALESELAISKTSSEFQEESTETYMAAIDSLSISRRRWLLLPARHHLVSLLLAGVCLPKVPQRSFQLPLCFSLRFPSSVLWRSVSATIYTLLYSHLNLSPQV